MGVPETASQCLCPIDNGESTDSIGDDADTRVKNRQLDYNNSPLNKIKSKTESGGDLKTERHPLPTTPPQPLLRRSSRFYEGGNAQQCIEACRRGFLSALTLTTTPSPLPLPSASSAGIVDSDDGVSLPAACSALSDSNIQQDLWQLYWCDSAFCGVWIDADGGLGQDPNVDLFINECQNIGYYSVLDPGPPPADYYCSSLLTAGPSGNPCRKAVQTVSETSSAVIVTSNNLAAPPATTSTPTATATGTGTGTGTGISSTGSSQEILPTVAPASGITSTSNTNTMHSTPTPGAKAAIAVCSVLAAALLAALVFFFFKKRRNGLSGQPYQHQDSMGGGHGGGTRDGLNDGMATVGTAAQTNADERGKQSEHDKHDSVDLAGASGPVGFKTRLRQSQMLFLPGHFRGTLSAPRSRNARHPLQSGDEVPTPLISPANSCNSAPGVIDAASLYKMDSAQTQSQKQSARSQWPFLFPSTLFSRRSRHDRSISPPLTSLSPPPSPTQLSARGSGAEQADINPNSSNSHPMYYGYNGSPVPYYFPSSPICAPTTNKLEPRKERTPTIKSNKSASSLKGAAANPKPPQALGYYDFQNNQQPPVPALPQSYTSPLDRHSAVESAGSAQGLRSSYGSYSTAPNASIPASSLYGNALTTNLMEPMTPVPNLPQPPSPASPARPPRPHESPLEIPDLVMPDPPPLPPPPRRSMSNANTSQSFSMPASAFSFSSVGGRKHLSIAHPPPLMPIPLPTVTLSAPPPPSEHIVYANSLDSFSSHSGAIANYSATSGASSQASKARMNPKEPILPAGPPPTRTLPPPPPPPPVPPMSSKRLSNTASLASMARSLSLSPQPPRCVRETEESIVSSFELPTLLLRDDHDDDSHWQGKPDMGTATSRNTDSKASKDSTVPFKGQTSSISSTMSASTMLSSSTADTMATLASMATLATITTSTTLDTTPVTAMAEHTDVFTRSSSLTVKPEADNSIPSAQTSV